MKPAIHPPLPCGYPTPTTFVILDSPTLVIQPGYEPKSQAEVVAIIQRKTWCMKPEAAHAVVIGPDSGVLWWLRRRGRKWQLVSKVEAALK